MELTYDIAQAMIRERVDKYPALQKLVAAPAFDQTLRQILAFENLNPSLFERIRFELMIVLTVYAPLNELSGNISEGTGLTLEQSENLVQTIKAVLIPSDMLQDLILAQIAWAKSTASEDKTLPSAVQPTANSQPAPVTGEVPDADSTLRDELLLKPRMTEKIVERAVPEPGAKPLTREEILRSLAAKRTLQSDVSALQQDPSQH
jgi:hypothetical protein